MNTYIKNNARFTVMREGVIRMEYAEGGAFCNDETLFAKRDAEYEAKFTLDGDILTVETGSVTLTYKGDGMFCHDNLYAYICTGGVDTVWHFGDQNRENLKGTLSTLDGVDGFREVPDGLLSRDGWYVIDDSAAPVLGDGWIKNRDSAHKCDMYLFTYGHNYKQALKDLAAVSGDMEMPRKYFLGSWYSRWHRYTADEFLQIIDEYDEHGFPIDILVMDMDWHYHDWGHGEGEPYAMYGYGHAGGNLGWTGYTWNRSAIPDPPGLLAELHRRGIAVTLNDHPCDGVRDHEETYPEMMRLLDNAGYSEEVPTIEDKVSDREREGMSRGVKNYRFNAGSKTYMDAFFESTHSKIEADGADFWWLDWQQDYIYPEVNGIKGLSHLRWLNHLYYQHSEKNGKRGQSFSRWGGFGDHKHPAYFSGDSVTNWDTLNFEIQMTVSAGNAGCFWWSHDIGGFMDPVPGGQAEIYVRWVQFGMTSAALRIHVCGELDRRPWKWGEKYCDAMRDMFRLRSCLMPYIYSAAYESSSDSVPLLRPLYLEQPECEEAYKHPATYYFGGGMISSPICEAGEGDTCTVTSKIWLPDGQWYGWFDGKRYEGGEVSVKCDLNTFPLFAAAGYPIVTRPYTSRMASAPLDNMTVKIYCGKGDIQGSTVLFEDDGITDGYKSGKCRKTSISYTKENGVHTVHFKPSADGYDGEVSARCITVELHDCDRAACDKYTADYDEASRCVSVCIGKVSPDKELTIILK